MKFKCIKTVLTKDKKIAFLRNKFYISNNLKLIDELGLEHNIRHLDKFLEYIPEVDFMFIGEDISKWSSWESSGKEKIIPYTIIDKNSILYKRLLTFYEKNKTIFSTGDWEVITEENYLYGK